MKIAVFDELVLYQKVPVFPSDRLFNAMFNYAMDFGYDSEVLLNSNFSSILPYSDRPWVPSKILAMLEYHNSNEDLSSKERIFKKSGLPYVPLGFDFINDNLLDSLNSLKNILSWHTESTMKNSILDSDKRGPKIYKQSRVIMKGYIVYESKNAVKFEEILRGLSDYGFGADSTFMNTYNVEFMDFEQENDGDYLNISRVIPNENDRINLKESYYEISGSIRGITNKGNKSYLKPGMRYVLEGAITKKPLKGQIKKFDEARDILNYPLYYYGKGISLRVGKKLLR